MATPSIFTQHSRSWQRNQFVYPVVSRRAKGLSIGVNLNPDKVCNFDCVYCCVDRTTPGEIGEVDLEIVGRELDDLLGILDSGELFAQPPLDRTPAEFRRLNDIAFSGNGEPTAYARFADACRLAAGMLEKHGRREAKIVVITNATLLHRPAIQEALEFLDGRNGEIWAKLDAGTQDYYRRIERTSIPLARVLENIRLAGQRREIVIQSLFLEYQGEAPPSAEIGAYVDRLRELVRDGCRIKLVQVYTVARATAEARCAPLPPPALGAIADQVRQTTHLRVEAYYGPQ